MERKYAEYDAKNGPLFPNLKHKDRLNFEDSSLATDKWTTKMCNRELEAMPVILERDELELQDTGATGGEGPVVEESDVMDLLTSMIENIHLSSEPTSSSAEKKPSVSGIQGRSESNDEFSCIFSNAVPSVHSIRENEFETMYSNESFAKSFIQNVKSPSVYSVDSSSDEDLDDYFKFKMSLPKKKFGQICLVQSTEAMTELVDSGNEDLSPIASPLPVGKEPKAGTSEQNLLAASQCEIVMGTMEADFSDSLSSEDYIQGPPIGRISRPLNLRYSSHEIDNFSAKKLCHTTSLMSFSFLEDNDIASSDESPDDLNQSMIFVPSPGNNPPTPMDYDELAIQIPSSSSESASLPATPRGQDADMQEEPEDPATPTDCAGKPLEKKVKRKYWWKLKNMRSSKRHKSDDETEDESSDP